MKNIITFASICVFFMAGMATAQAQTALPWFTNAYGGYAAGLPQIQIGTNVSTATEQLIVTPVGAVGTARFNSTVAANATLINSGLAENTYINGGKAASQLYLNTSAGLGNITLGNGTNVTTINSVLMANNSATFSGTTNQTIINAGLAENTTVNGGKAGSLLLLNTLTGVGNINAGNGANSFNMTGSMSVSKDLAVTGNINMAATSYIQSPTSMQLVSGTSKLVITPTSATLIAPVTNFTGNMAVSGSATVTGDINMAGASSIQSPTNLQLVSGTSKMTITPTSATLIAPVTTVQGNMGVTGTTTLSGDIYTNGLVKIGVVTTSALGYKLFVEKGILTEKVKVAVKGTAQWADYVFDKKYKLMPLAEVAKYVDQHHHLPNVPSAEEMVEEGNDLGKMDAKLLEKIEELTLYLIDLKKESEVQRAENAKQAKEIEQLKKQLKK